MDRVFFSMSAMTFENHKNDKDRQRDGLALVLPGKDNGASLVTAYMILTRCFINGILPWIRIFLPEPVSIYM